MEDIYMCTAMHDFSSVHFKGEYTHPFPFPCSEYENREAQPNASITKPKEAINLVTLKNNLSSSLYSSVFFYSFSVYTQELPLKKKIPCNHQVTGYSDLRP